MQKVDPTVTIEDSHHMSMHDMKNEIETHTHGHETGAYQEEHQEEKHETVDSKTHGQEKERGHHYGKD